MKRIRIPSNSERGYTLIEVLAVAAVIMFASVFLLRLSGSITGRGKFTSTDNRMAIIEAKIRQYYLAHEQLPVNEAPLATDEIPVGISSLDLEQKYRLDGWGQFFQYDVGAVDPITGVASDLQDFGEDNDRAVSITSGGPDQNITTANDNIVKEIDLSAEAEQVARKKLSLLMEKVASYDALFAGVDNDGVSEDNPTSPNPAPIIDEDPLEGATTLDTSTSCPPAASFSNDPASGLWTLDNIEKAMDGVAGGFAYSCSSGSPLSFHLATYYHLRTGFPGGYDIDPWNRPFKWGYPGRELDDDSIIDDSLNYHHYHKFFSSGPDDTTVDDDIIYQNY